MAALSATVGNMFKKKGAKAIEYPDKPFDLKGNTDESEYDSEGMSEEEKRKKTELLFARLQILKTNFDITHGTKDNRGDE